MMDLMNLRIQYAPSLASGSAFCAMHPLACWSSVVGMASGFCTDVLGYLVNQGGGFYFPGYTLTAVSGGLIWGLWLYRPQGGIADEKPQKSVFCVLSAPKHLLTSFATSV